MENTEHYVQQDDAEFRIETMNAEEINQVSGGAGTMRFLGGSTYNPHAKASSMASGKQVYVG